MDLVLSAAWLYQIVGRPIQHHFTNMEWSNVNCGYGNGKILWGMGMKLQCAVGMGEYRNGWEMEKFTLYGYVWTLRWTVNECLLDKPFNYSATDDVQQPSTISVVIQDFHEIKSMESQFNTRNLWSLINLQDNPCQQMAAQQPASLS